MFQTNVRNLCMGLALGALVAGAAWADETTPASPPTTPAPAKAAKPAAKDGDEVAVLETSKGKMVVEFWEKDAPKTVASFKTLARKGYFDGTGFHRIIKGFMIQGGDPNSKNPNAANLGTGGPGYTIPDEFNSHRHLKGVLSMANTGSPNSGGSQFFIMHGTNAGLDGHYTAFGHLISGMGVLDKIANSPTGPNPTMPNETSKPLEWTSIKSVKIMSKSAYTASVGGGKKASTAAKPAASKHAETKAGMGSGAGMDMKAGQGAATETKAEETKTPPSESTQPPAEQTQPETQTPPESQGGK